mgnify:FL=1
MKKILSLTEVLKNRKGEPFYEDTEKTIQSTIGSLIIRVLDTDTAKGDARRCINLANMIEEAMKEDKDAEFEDNGDFNFVQERVKSYPFVSYVAAKLEEAMEESEEEYRNRKELNKSQDNKPNNKPTQ